MEVKSIIAAGGRLIPNSSSGAALHLRQLFLC